MIETNKVRPSREGSILPGCPECGSKVFNPVGAQIVCEGCGNVERYRVARLLIDFEVKPQPDWRILHIAPEIGLAKYLKSICGNGYEAFDFNPDKYITDGLDVNRIDLCKDAKDLPKDNYDLVIHNHVIEHLPCNWACALINLHAAVKPGGVHLFSFPVVAGYYREDLNPSLSREQRKELFGQHNHFRRFGRSDFSSTVGAIFPELNGKYSITKFLNPETLVEAGIREKRWRCSSASVFLVRKSAEK